MKKLLLIAIVAVFCSCKHRSVIDQKLYDYFLINGHNPESYEQISTKCTDTITVKNHKDANDYLIQAKIEELHNDSSHFEFWKTRTNSDSTSAENMEFHMYTTELQSDLKDLIGLKAKDDSLQKLGKNIITGYHFLHQFRAKVPLGGLMLKNAFIETDKDFNIVSFDEQLLN